VAIKLGINFQLSIIGDGTSTTLDVAFGNAPILLTESNAITPPGFSLIGHVTGVDNLGTNGGLTVTATLDSTKSVLSLTFSSAVSTSGDVLTGRLLF
jgi:hypothetical protein